ncbi:GIY-YIG nuclease family protein [Chromohalobacter canadensis]|uniref:GIY-YIG nuclease family protein n=1 Tax=Chromohalobacter canadensis TaxID=141389 RepID=A0ABZ0YDA7_9GAMM|nr:GIY-YIG nuclease family protein [Chromohalobacter canadensis]MCK0767346.1 GIY-YIG nuclease family protein [Chromohalobacter canadensis]WQH10050.1 GIY-YIG nuclease family protein [Chromohalobacter canadensis]
MIRTRREPPKRRTLDDIFATPDELGLLNVAPSKSSAPSADQRLVATLQGIEIFVTAHGREPREDAKGLNEATLAVQLAALRNDPAKAEGLADRDTLGLLEVSADNSEDTACHDRPAKNSGASRGAGSATLEATPSKPEKVAVSPDSVTSLDDIWESDTLGLLSGDDESVESIFDLTHVPESSEREMPEEIAHRAHCDDFYRFESLFDQVREELREGDAETVPFQMESQIEEGDMFVLNGMLCIADQVGEESVGAGRKFNPRLRVVFDNGTESNLLLRSLARALYKDETGRRILRRDNTFDVMQGITHHDKRTGLIYILRSLSQDPALRGIRNLYKIGYTEKELDQRLAGAERQQTYLEAPVQVATSFECYNLDPRRFERLVHAMLYHQRVNVLLHSRDGSTYRPREWFDVELDTARDIVWRIVDGSITQYRMDNTTGRLVGKR